MKLFRGRGFHVVFEKESEELHRAMECLSQCHSCLRVEYEERILFLTPFVHLLIDFMDADGSGNVLNIKSVEDEMYKLYSELYPRE